VFALLKVGAVQVLIDPGMGKRQVLRSLTEVEPRGFIAIPGVQLARRILRRNFPSATINVTAGTHGLFSSFKALGQPLDEIRRIGMRENSQNEFEPFSAQIDSPAAIIFTSGSTGPAKGVLYRHGNFAEQVQRLREFYDVHPGEVDVSCFPLFGLFNAAMGVTTVFPKMDFSRPAMVDPRNIVAAANQWQATQAFGSPAVWNLVGRYCEEHSIRLPTLRRVLSAGAPVAAHVLERMVKCIHPEGTMHTPYGATEALPVASISAADVLGSTIERTRQGAGVCVGGRFGGIDWKVIRLQDGPIAVLDDAEEMPLGESGELIVRGRAVTTEYATRLEANAKAKIRDGEWFWHRMGDVGYLDAQDRFWFCGRMSQRVMVDDGPTKTRTLFTIPCESIFNRHPDVFRSALVGIGSVGQRRAAIVVEPLPGMMPRGRRQREELTEQLRTLGQSSELTKGIEYIFICKSLPVDVRHNVKINREWLAVWAASKVR
jgi:acyl-coenzyme A synthetase/AMP-(fatty) acid ligase